MKKRDRHQLIKEMVLTSRLSTQRDIQLELEARGVEVTQTTLSRDLRELNLIKAREKGQSFYILPDVPRAFDFRALLSPYVIKAKRASFVLVLHTRLGEAALVSNIIDTAKPIQILGTVAGADTLLVICRDEAAAQEVERELAPSLDEE